MYICPARNMRAIAKAQNPRTRNMRSMVPLLSMYPDTLRSQKTMTDLLYPQCHAAIKQRRKDVP
jgi:hypothetical protein